MGSLSNLYISQSYQSLAHLGTNQALVPGTMTQLQDGIGQSLNISFDGTNISSSGNIYAANITASAVNTSSLVTTSSFNSYTQSTNVRLNNLESTSASVNVSISNLNSTTSSFATSIANLNTYTASQSTASLVTSITELNSWSASAKVSISSLNTNSASVNTSISALNTFTASQSTASIVTSINNLNTFSASALVSISNINSTTASLNSSVSQLNASSASQQVSINSLNSATSSYVTETESGSFLVTASVVTNVITFTKGDGSQFNLTVAASGSAPAGTISGSAQITALGFVSSSVTASSLVTASFDNGTRNLTFTKGDASQFSVNIPDVSGSTTINTGSFVTTSSFNAYTASNDQRVSSLEIATSSLYTSASLSLTTASIAGQILQFRKGDATTFNLTLPTGSGTIVTGSYAQFYDITTQSGSANTAYAIKLGNTAVPDGVILSGSGGMQVGAAGVYNIQFSLQTNQGASSADLNVWFKKNGTNIANSDTQWTLPSNTKLVPVVNILDQAQLGDVYEIWWKSTSANTTFAAIAAGVDSPEVPSVIATIFRVDVGGGTNTVTTGSFNAYTASVNSSITQLNASSASQQISIDNLNQKTGSYATTGSNLFIGNETVSGFVSASLGFYSGPNTTALNVGDGSNIRFWSGSTGGTEYFNVQLVPGTGDVAFSRSGAGNVKVMTLGGVAGNNTTFQNNPVVFNDTVSSLTVNAQSTAISGSGSYTLSAASIVEGAVTATTTATASVIGTFAVTGQIGGDGKAIVLGQSGSLVLTNSSVTPTYSSLAHLSSSVANANTNLIFKTNTNAADTIISGSGNIFANPTAPTAGFKRYIGTNNIFTHPSSVPQISGSMGFSPTMNANIINNNSNAFTFRGPVSSSASLINHNLIAGGTINLGTAAATNFEKANSGTSLFSNIINGTVNAIAYKTPLSSSVQFSGNVIAGAVTLNLDSSSVNMGSNNINGSLTINNSYFPGTVTSVSSVVGLNANTIGGTLTLYTSGSNTTFTGATRGIIASLNSGFSNTISASFNGDNSSVNSISLLGQSLIVYGNNSRQTGTTAADWGSAFVGRWNDVNGNKAYTADTVFAVGTGTGASTRKNGLLIDSASNSYFEGTVSVSGSFAVTGSAYGNVVALSITANTASMDLSKGNYFTLTLADSTTTHISASNVLPGMSATLVITTGTNSSASLAPTMLQPSGSAYSATNGSAKKDVLSIVSVASGVPYVVSTLNMI